MISFSLKSKGKAATGSAPTFKKPTTLGDFEDESVDAAVTARSSGRADVNKRLAALNSADSKAQRKRIVEAQTVDQSVFQYDEVYDRMQDAKLRAKEAKEEESKVRQPKYIKGLLMTAETRRLDYLRAEEKMIQREREAEGNEFEGKEQFVTQAYKDQMAAVRKAEEEEKGREEKMRRENMSTGMTHMYRQMLQQSEQQHSATMEAMETPEPVMNPSANPSPNLTIIRPPSIPTKSDKQLAAEALAAGREVELNDDNQIVDRRELLSAGLNLAAPNTRKAGLQAAKRKASGTSDDLQVHRAVGTAASRREINERRAREIQQQLEEETERVRLDKARREQEDLERSITKRNTDEQISTARERYLQRKRRKLEEQPDGDNGG